MSKMVILAYAIFHITKQLSASDILAFELIKNVYSDDWGMFRSLWGLRRSSVERLCNDLR